MIIFPQHNSVLLRLNRPERVTNILPTSKRLIAGGVELVAVRHGVEEVRVLRNLGIAVPSPINYHFDWPGRVPFEVQRKTAEFLTVNPRAYVLNSLGTGKTLATLWAMEYLRRAGVIRRALVIAPLSTLERVWADEAFRAIPSLDLAVVYGTAQRRVKLLQSDRDLYIINHDGVKSPHVMEAILARKDIDLIIIDELAVFRTSGTDRWKCVRKLVANRPWAWGLTGRPTPNAPTDAWAQIRLLTPDRVPKFFKMFRDQTMRQVTQFKWVPRPDALQTVHNVMQPAIRFSLDECVDLPPEIVEVRDVAMSEEQERAYRHMFSRLRTEYEGGEVLAVNEAVKLQKLVQIGAGVAYTPDGKEVHFPCDSRLAETEAIIEASEGKTIVFVPLSAGLEKVAAHLSKTYTVAVVEGATPKNQRDQIFHDFQHASNPQVLVAHPACMAHGLTLTAATTICWYIPIVFPEIYEQANGRTRRPGQTRTTVIIHLAGSAAERKVYRRLQEKGEMQDVLLELFKEDSV